MILILSLIMNVCGHMPVFPGEETSAISPFHLKDVTTKSWGVYGVLKESVVWLSMDGVEGEEMTVSLQRGEDAGYYDVAIWGAGMSSVNCTPGWYGWEHGISGVFATHDTSELPQSVRDAIGNSEALVLHGDAKEDVEYEPFGVNLYWPLGGCKDRFPASGVYNMAVVHDFNKTVSFSLGVGMVESFGLDELITMSYVMVDTFVWGGRSLVSVLAILLFSTAFVYMLQLYVMSRRGYTELGGSPLLSLATHLVWLGAAGMIGSSSVWLGQVIWCYGKLSDLGRGVWVALGVHIGVPVLFGGLILGLYDPRRLSATRKLWYSVGVFLAGAYALFMVWQGYVVVPVLIMLGALIHLIRV